MIDEAHLERLELVARAAKLKVTAQVVVVPVQAEEFVEIISQLRADRERIAELQADLESLAQRRRED